MIHMHGMLSSDTNTSAAGQTSLPLSQSKLDSFHGALSEAVSSTLEKFGIHPNDVKISITRASRRFEDARRLANSTSGPLRQRPALRHPVPQPVALASSSTASDGAACKQRRLGSAEWRIRSVFAGRLRQPLPKCFRAVLYEIHRGILDGIRPPPRRRKRRKHSTMPIGPSSRPLFNRCGLCKIRNSAQPWPLSWQAKAIPSTSPSWCGVGIRP